MQHSQIKSIINKYYQDTEILSLAINICDINHQIERIKIIFPEDSDPNISAAGSILNDLQLLTIDDNYGDLTECTIKFTRYEPTPNEGLTVSLEFICNIDS